MRTRLTAFLLLLFGITTAPGAAPTSAIVRVLTYNIHHGEGTDREFDLVRIADIIKGTEPDLVALQEVDQETQRSGGVDQLSELGRLTGMNQVFGKAMDFQGGGYGVGVLSQFQVLHAETSPLPGLPGREPRAALTVSVRIAPDGPIVRFTSTHLDAGRDVENRVAQAERLNQLLAESVERPAILAGDFNSRADTEVMQILGVRWTPASPPDVSPIDPAARPYGRVDHVLVRPAGSWQIVDSNVIDAPVASDHRPVLAVIEWNPQP